MPIGIASSGTIALKGGAPATRPRSKLWILVGAAVAQVTKPEDCQTLRRHPAPGHAAA